VKLEMQQNVHFDSVINPIRKKTGASMLVVYIQGILLQFWVKTGHFFLVRDVRVGCRPHAMMTTGDRLTLELHATIWLSTSSSRLIDVETSTGTLIAKALGSKHFSRVAIDSAPTIH
jgi:hypothetical protein